jgi:PAS domain S-box-containing protein
MQGKNLRKNADDGSVKIPGQNSDAAVSYHFLFNQSPDGIVIMSPDGTFIDFNEAAHRQLGYTRDEFAKLHLSNIDPFQTPEEIQDSVKNVLEKGRDEFEVRHRTAAGEIRDVHVITQSMALSGRTVFHSIWRDVTERKCAEKALWEAQEKYRDLFENAHDAIFIVDAALHYIDVNKRATEIYGFSREEFLAMKITDVIPPEQLPRSKVEFEKLWKHQAYEKFIGKMRTKDGRWLDVEINSSPIIKDNKVCGSRDIVRDITERKRAEDALRMSQNYLQTIIDTEPECVKLLDRDGAVLMMNRAGLDMIEAGSLDEVKGKSIYELVSPEYREAFRTNVNMVFEGKSGTLEFEIVGLKGRRLRLETHAVPLFGENDRIIALLGITRDITERKKLEEELIKAQKLESVGLLAGGIAHDFNNLLTAVLGYINLAKKHIGAGDAAGEHLVKAENASLRARDLTRQLLTFSRGGAPVRKTASLREVIKESASFALRGSDVKYEFFIPDDLWPVDMDEGQIGQVVQNLTINADDAMPGGGTVRITCRNVGVPGENVLPLMKGDYVRVSVEDRGTGIAKEHLPKIFDPYFTTKPKGSGLGLATSYSIIKNHDGYITVESEPGVGTAFHFYLPASDTRGHAATARGDKPLPAGGGRILVMDDEETVREVVADMLKHLGYEVEVARDGVEMLIRYMESRNSGKTFDAVIMDLTVPGGMGGKEAVRKLLEFDPAVKAIVSSGYANNQIMADYKNFGFAGVITKPFVINHLAATLDSVMKPSA